MDCDADVHDFQFLDIQYIIKLIVDSPEEDGNDSAADDSEEELTPPIPSAREVVESLDMLQLQSAKKKSTSRTCFCSNVSETERLQRSPTLTIEYKKRDV